LGMFEKLDKAELDEEEGVADELTLLFVFKD
jgi:hypothetical protein